MWNKIIQWLNNNLKYIDLLYEIYDSRLFYMHISTAVVGPQVVRDVQKKTVGKNVRFYTIFVLFFGVIHRSNPVSEKQSLNVSLGKI